LLQGPPALRDNGPSTTTSPETKVTRFVQTDDKVTGSCKAADKEVPVTGTLEGKKVTWKYDMDYNGSPLTLTYTATLDDSEKITGSVEVAPFGVSGEFTATPSKEAGK
jgi:hypothetical protein